MLTSFCCLGRAIIFSDTDDKVDHLERTRTGILAEKTALDYTSDVGLRLSAGDLLKLAAQAGQFGVVLPPPTYIASQKGAGSHRIPSP